MLVALVLLANVNIKRQVEEQFSRSLTLAQSISGKLPDTGFSLYISVFFQRLINIWLKRNSNEYQAYIPELNSYQNKATSRDRHPSSRVDYLQEGDYWENCH